MSSYDILSREGGNGTYTSPSLTANLVFRVFLGILAILALCVPTKLLWRNGEFAAVVFCLDVVIFNIFYVVNSLIWPNDNVASWWAGYGWCDIQVYMQYSLETLYAACVFAIMRHLAHQVGLMRVTALTISEKRRRNLIQALVLFPIPLLQVALNYLVMAQRYDIVTLIGCVTAYDSSWPYLVFFVLPAPIFTIGAVYFAILTWKRFRDVDKTAKAAMSHNNSSAALRHRRVKRKLFYMSAAILVPYAPVELLYFGNNISEGWPWTKPYNFNQIHYGLDPFPWDTINFVPGYEVSFALVNVNYIPIITVIPIFWCFGMTKEAVNTYRKLLLAIGLGRAFPRLHEEYDPDRTRNTGTSISWINPISSFLKSHKGMNQSASASGKGSIIPTIQHRSLTSENSNGSSSRLRENDITLTNISASRHSPSNEDGNTGPDIDTPISAPGDASTVSHRNPWIFRTTLTTPIKMPPLVMPSFRRKKAGKESTAARQDPEAVGPVAQRNSAVGAAAGTTEWTNSPTESMVHTRVWFDEDIRSDAAGEEAHAESEVGRAVRVQTDIASSTEAASQRGGI